MNLPDYQYLPAPFGLINALHLLTLTLHFAAMNFVVGGVVAVLWAGFDGRGEHPVVQRFVGLFPTAMAATVTLGVAPLLFLQLVYPHQVYAASIISAWYWLAVIGAVITGYYLLYGAALSTASGSGRRRLLLFAALICLLYVSLAYSSVFSLAERPGLMKQLYAADPSGRTWNPDAGAYAFRWLHMILGAVTVGGFFVGLLGKDDAGGFRAGRNLFLWGMVLAALAGFGYLFSLGPHLRSLMRSPAIWTLNISIVLAAGALHFFFRRRFVPAAALLFISLLLMVYTRHALRLLQLETAYNPASVRVAPQWSPFLLFLACFVLALGVVAWILRLFFRGARNR